MLATCWQHVGNMLATCWRKVLANIFTSGGEACRAEVCKFAARVLSTKTWRPRYSRWWRRCGHPCAPQPQDYSRCASRGDHPKSEHVRNAIESTTDWHPRLSPRESIFRKTLNTNNFSSMKACVEVHLSLRKTELLRNEPRNTHHRCALGGPAWSPGW